MVSIEIFEESDCLERLSTDWCELLGDQYFTTMSQPAWYQAWLDAFPNTRIFVVTARINQQLVGVMPLGIVRSDARGMYFNRVGPFARADYQPPVVDPACAAEVLPAMLDAAFKHIGRSGVLWWPNIPSTEPSLELLRAYLRDRGMPWMEERETAPRLRLDGRTFAEVEKDWSSSHRIDVRRQRKRLAEKGPIRLWFPASVEQAEPVLNEFFDVHDQKWLEQGFPGMFQDPTQRDHFRALLRRLWGRGIFFSTLRCGDTHVSYAMAFFSGKWIQLYRPSYRSEFHNFSPSKIHTALLLEEACAQQWQGFDFLLGEETYKKAWANDNMEVVSIHAGFSRWSPAYFWFSTGKPYFRARFAATHIRARARIQKLRQALKRG